MTVPSGSKGNLLQWLAIIIPLVVLLVSGALAVYVTNVKSEISAEQQKQHIVLEERIMDKCETMFYPLVEGSISAERWENVSVKLTVIENKLTQISEQQQELMQTIIKIEAMQ